MMMDPNNVRVATTPQLIHLQQVAERYDFNRRFLPDDLDPDGRHILSLLLFGHGRGKRTDVLHHRVMMLVKIKDSNEPELTYFDVRDEDYNALPTVSQFKRGEVSDD